MRTSLRWCASPLLASMLLSGSCASPALLARQADREWAAGDVQGAYAHARRALDKDPHNARARAVLAAAAQRIAADWRQRVLDLSEVDTIAAARSSLELGQFRGEAAHYDVPLPVDVDFLTREERIRAAAAGIYYEQGQASLAGQRPKRAWSEFRSAREFANGYHDVDLRIREAHDLGVMHVAILPFANQTGLPGLGEVIDAHVDGALAPYVGPRELPFTVLLARDRVRSAITLDRAADLQRDDALAFGESLGAERVVLGRVYGLRTTTTSDSWEGPLYRKVVERDEEGESHERWIAEPFHAVIRERDVSVRYEVQVLDVRTGTRIASRAADVRAAARIVWSDARLADEPGHYGLVPPDADADETRKAQERWTSRLGTWTVASLVERAGRRGERERYRPDDRGAFYADTRACPVFLGELPPESDLAIVALDTIWRPVIDTLREQDPRDWPDGP